MAYDWSRQPLATSPWRKQVVPHIPSILIRWAKAGRRITYTQLADELYTIYGHEPKARKTLYGPAVGAVGFAIRELGERWGEKIPPLNLIVVEAETDLPGEGADAVADYFFPDGGAGITLDRRTAIEAAIDAVHDYGRRWDRVAEALGAELLGPTFDDPARMERFELPVIPDAYMPEGDKHKALKAWVSALNSSVYRLLLMNTSAVAMNYGLRVSTKGWSVQFDDSGSLRRRCEEQACQRSNWQALAYEEQQALGSQEFSNGAVMKSNTTVSGESEQWAL